MREPTAGPDDEHAAAVRSLLRDLLPVLVPGARMDGFAVVLPVGAARARIDMDSLISACRVAPHHRWSREVDAWLTTMTGRTAAALAARAEHGEVEQTLRVQVLPVGVGPRRPGIVATSFAGPFDLVVVRELPDGIVALTRTLSQDAALGSAGTHALRNTVEKVLPELRRERRQLTRDSELQVITSPGSAYASSALLDLTRFLPEDNDHGAMVSAPRAGVLLVHPVGPRHRTMAALAPLGKLSREFHTEGPQPWSAALFWWLPAGPDGERLVSPVEVAPDGTPVTTPDLEARLAALPRR